MSDYNELKELIDSFVAYRNVLTPLEENLRGIASTYSSIRDALDEINRTFAPGTGVQLDKINSTLNAQARSGKELAQKIDEYAVSGENYAKAVSDMTARFDDVAKKLEIVTQMEKSAEHILSKLEATIEEKKTSYNLKDLQKSLEAYNKGVEKISDFINKDVAAVLQENAKKIEEIRKENEALSAALAEQNKTVASLSGYFAETSSLLRKTLEGGAINEEYLFDAFDKWAADRKVKIKKK